MCLALHRVPNGFMDQRRTVSSNFQITFISLCQKSVLRGIPLYSCNSLFYIHGNEMGSSSGLSVMSTTYFKHITQTRQCINYKVVCMRCMPCSYALTQNGIDFYDLFVSNFMFVYWLSFLYMFRNFSRNTSNDFNNVSMYF